MIVEVFLPCYFGNEVSEASIDLSTRLFHTEWIKESKKFKKAMGMFMENTKNRLIVSAADGFFHVNLSGFLSLCNLAYSLFALLQRMN